MMRKTISIIIMFLVTEEAKLIVDYVRNEAVGIGKKPYEASTLISNDTVSSCSVKCTLRPTCISFYVGENTCGLYDKAIDPVSLMAAPGFNYYRMVTPGRDFKVVCNCPFRKPSQRDYQYINGRRLALKICPSTFLQYFIAKEACACTGGRLVAIKDNQTQVAVEELIRVTPNIGSLRVWIGFNGTTQQKNQPYSLERSDGKILNDTTKDLYTNLQEGFPFWAENWQKGIAVNKEEPFGKWRDWWYTDLYAYICEYL